MSFFLSVFAVNIFRPVEKVSEPPELKCCVAAVVSDVSTMSLSGGTLDIFCTSLRIWNDVREAPWPCSPVDCIWRF